MFDQKPNEWQICRDLEKIWNVALFKPRILAPASLIAVRRFDFMTIAYIDFRFRDCNSWQFNNFLAFKDKIDRAVYLASQNGIRYLYCIKFNDALLAAEIDEKQAAAFPFRRITRSGKPERTDYEIPIAIFKRAVEIEF